MLDETDDGDWPAETLASLSVRTVKSVRQHVASLSGGQRQTVAIAKAVLWNSKVVILDEPTAALGVAQTAQVLDLVRRLADQGLAVVLISHNMIDVLQVSDRIAALYLGRMAAKVKRTRRQPHPDRRADHRRPLRRPRPGRATPKGVVGMSTDATAAGTSTRDAARGPRGGQPGRARSRP